MKVQKMLKYYEVSTPKRCKKPRATVCESLVTAEVRDVERMEVAAKFTERAMSDPGFARIEGYQSVCECKYDKSTIYHCEYGNFFEVAEEYDVADNFWDHMSRKNVGTVYVCGECLTDKYCLEQGLESKTAEFVEHCNNFVLCGGKLYVSAYPMHINVVLSDGSKKFGDGVFHAAVKVVRFSSENVHHTSFIGRGCNVCPIGLGEYGKAVDAINNDLPRYVIDFPNLGDYIDVRMPEVFPSCIENVLENAERHAFCELERSERGVESAQDDLERAIKERIRCKNEFTKAKAGKERWDND